MAQRGVPMNALVRAYRLGHEMVLDFAREEINNAGLDPGMSLAVFERMTTVTFRYIDWISQQVVALTNRSVTGGWRTATVCERCECARCSMPPTSIWTRSRRRSVTRCGASIWAWCCGCQRTPAEAMSLLRWRDFSASSPNPLPPKIVRSLSRRTGSADGAGFRCSPGRPHRPSPTFDGSSRATTGRPSVALGVPLPGVEGFRRSHRQAQRARNVAIAAGPAAAPVTAASDPGMSAAALLGDNIDDAREWVFDEVLGTARRQTSMIYGRVTWFGPSLRWLQ